MPQPRRALIAGLGLIGGSAGIALRRAGWRVAYLDPQVTLEEARSAGAADERAASLGASADIVILAMPADAAIAALESDQAPRTLITSVCSVMAPLREAADRRHHSFVAGHPLAGSHERGLDAARGDLFEGKPWFVDRDEQAVTDIVAACGARTERVDAQEHDRALALTSHLPQVLSTALAAAVAEGRVGGGRELIEFAGSGLRTFLRLAASDASVWRPVIAANRENIRNGLDAVVAIARAILDGEDAGAFERANDLWSKL